MVLTISEISAELLNRLREGNIWGLHPNEAKRWLSIAEQNPRNEIPSMRLRSLVAELADRRGWWHDVEPQALQNVEEIRIRFFSRRDILPPDSSETRWFRQAGWLLLHDARRLHRSPDDVGARSERHKNAAIRALDAAESLQKKLSLILPEPGNHELLYRTAFSIARHCQVLEQYPRAKEELIKAVGHCYQHRLEILVRMNGLDPNEIEEGRKLELKQNFTLFNTTVVVANLGRIAVEQGELKQAQMMLMIARTMLLDSNDIVMRGFLELQLGTVYRQIGSPAHDPAEFLARAIDLFKTAHHPQLDARATLELAQHYYNLAALSGETNQLRKAEKILSTEPDDLPRSAVDRWQAHRQLLRARIEYLKPDHDIVKATSYATEAKHLSDEVNRKDLGAIARLVLAELNIKAGENDKALDLCIEVEALDPADRSDKAWLYLVFAHAWMSQGDRSAAEGYFDKWLAIRDKLENFHIKQKAADVERLLKSKQGFYIPPPPEDTSLDFPERVEQLKLYLIQRVQVEGGTLEEQAIKLGVKKQTLANWRAQLIKKRKLEGRPRLRRNMSVGDQAADGKTS